MSIGLAALCLALAAPSGDASVNRRTPVVEAVEKALPSVVNIGTERLVMVRYSDPASRFRGDLFDQFFSEFFGQPPAGYRVSHSLGSGVVIDPRGFILTNYHVIERASKIRVTLADERSYDAVALAGDELNDLALIQIKPERPLQSVEFGRDDDLLLGETVIALGNPFGLAQTVTVGVLSAKNREARYGGQVLFRDILQTDAAVNPGSSGGPLLNLDGLLIGINVAIYREAQNIGFALPVSRARGLLSRWLAPRYIGKTWPGFEADGRDGGVRVTEVAPSAAVAEPAPAVGDRILEAGGRPVSDLYDLYKALLGRAEGERVPLKVERDGQVLEVAALISPVPKPSGPALAARRLGIAFADPAASEGRSRAIRGLAIETVETGGAGARVGLRPGLFVTRINESAVNTLDDVGLALERVRPGDVVVLGLVSLEETGSFILAQSSSVPVKAD